MAGFLSKLTGGNNTEEVEYNKENEFESNIDYGMNDIMDSSDEISLAVDAYEDEDNLYIKAFIPAINPKEIDIDISRDIVTISAERFEVEEKDQDQYFQKELSWGRFKKRIMLPKEIDIESIKASVKHGTLTLRLPKIDKDRKVRVQIN